MKVLILCHEYPPGGGGAGLAAHQAGRYLALWGHAVTLVTARHAARPTPLPGLPYRLVEVGRPQRSVSGGNPLAWMNFMLAGTRAALVLADAERPNVAFAFLTLPAGAPAAILREKRGVPFVVLLQGGDVPGFFPPEYGRYHAAMGWAIRAVWRRAAALVVPTPGLRKIAMRAGATDATVIPGGVDLELFQPAPTGPPRGGPVTILTAGRFAPQKNNAGLLRAAAEAARLVARPFRLELVGDGPEREALVALAASLGLGDRVAFLPWRSREALVARYQAAHLFVLASHEEPFGLAVLEAMACGLPILGTRTDGPAETVAEGENGFLVPPGDDVAMAHALATLLEDDGLRARMAARSRERATRYGWEETARAFAGVLERAADGRAA